jgi:hypothetical protein
MWNGIRGNKSRRTWHVKNAVRLVREYSSYKTLSWISLSEDLRVCGRMILKCILTPKRERERETEWCETWNGSEWVRIIRPMMGNLKKIAINLPVQYESESLTS